MWSQLFYVNTIASEKIKQIRSKFAVKGNTNCHDEVPFTLYVTPFIACLSTILKTNAIFCKNLLLNIIKRVHFKKIDTRQKLQPLLLLQRDICSERNNYKRRKNRVRLDFIHRLLIGLWK